MSAGLAIARGSAFSQTEVADQHARTEAGTDKLNTGVSAASVFGFERAGLHGFIFCSLFCLCNLLIERKEKSR